MIIDAHCHVGQGIIKSFTVEQLIGTMKSCKVDKVIICPIEEQIVVYNREGNNFIAKAVKQYPEKLIGFAVANPWYGKVAVQELERAFTLGLKGLKINSALQGFPINDELIYPLIETAQRHKAPVYVHSGTPIHSLPFEVLDLAIEFPETTFIMGHMGFVDHYWSLAIQAAEKSDNIILETSHVSFISVLENAIASVGPERVVFGSDSPMSKMNVELNKIRSLKLERKQEELILGENIRRIIGLR